MLEGGLGPPVVLVADQEVLLLPGPAHQLVGPRPDGVVLHPLVALLADHLLGLHRQRGHALDEEGIRAVGLEPGGVVVHRLDALDLQVVAAERHLPLGIEDALERRLDVARGEGAPVVELDARAELHLPGGVVHRPPRGGEARADLPGLGVAGGQVVEDVVAEDDALAEHRVGWVPVRHVRQDRVDDGVVLRLRGQVGGQREPESQRENPGEGDGTPHGSPPSLVTVAGSDPRSGPMLEHFGGCRKAPSGRRRRQNLTPAGGPGKLTSPAEQSVRRGRLGEEEQGVHAGGGPMRLKFWGTAGSFGLYNPERARYGCNTLCLEIRSDCLPPGHHLYVDSGTGIIAASREFLRFEGRAVVILQTHHHLDHIIGLPRLDVPLSEGHRGHLRGAGRVRQGVAGGARHHHEPPALPGSRSPRSPATSTSTSWTCPRPRSSPSTRCGG